MKNLDKNEKLLILISMQLIITILRGMSTQHKIRFIFAHITSYRIFLKFGTVGQPSINSEMDRIKNQLAAKF